MDKVKNEFKKPLKKFIVMDIESLQEEFYRTYDPDYWLYKIVLLQNSHDHFEKFKELLTQNLSEVSDEDYKRMLRTEMHFLYFQMIEALFEIIFAISHHDNRDLWIALTFSNDKKTAFYSDAYTEIKKLAMGKMKQFLARKIIATIQNKKVEIPLIRWLFYFIYPSKMSNEDWEKNLENIERMLDFFARDFSERGEYNAYKHSLRFYNAKFALALSSIGMKQVKVSIPLGQSNDSIIFLEEHDRNNPEVEIEGRRRIAKTVKPFDFERDTRACFLIHALIKNIIHTRKYTIFKELHNKDFEFSTFIDIKLPEHLIPKTGVTRSSFTT